MNLTYTFTIPKALNPLMKAVDTAMKSADKRATVKVGKKP
jgi:hypothetical protein